MFEALSLFEKDSQLSFLLQILLTVFIICKSIQFYQTRPTKFYYSQTNTLMTQFMEKSKIKQMSFRPHFLLLWHVPQTFTFLLVEFFNQTFRHIKTEDEFFKCPDGGTVGVAWSYCKDGTGKPNGKHGQKPILLLAPGLGGRIDNLYTTAILVYARSRGYKVGTIYFRCC